MVSVRRNSKVRTTGQRRRGDSSARPTDFGGFALSSLRFTVTASGRTLADFDAASQASLPPPQGAYAGEALMYQGRRAVGEKLVQILGHRNFIPATGLLAPIRYCTIR